MRFDTRLLLGAGALVALSGVAHLLVRASVGGPLTGPVSWRKPIAFGLSVGVALLSFAWVTSCLPERRATKPLAWLIVVMLVVEVGLIDMQQWRGVASHFNLATPFDGAVFNLTGALIVRASCSSPSATCSACSSSPGATFNLRGRRSRTSTTRPA
jgi:hypothetical protein